MVAPAFKNPARKLVRILSDTLSRKGKLDKQLRDLVEAGNKARVYLGKVFPLDVINMNEIKTVDPKPVILTPRSKTANRPQGVLVEEGEICLLSSPRNWGKSTLLKQIVGDYLEVEHQGVLRILKTERRNNAKVLLFENETKIEKTKKKYKDFLGDKIDQIYVVDTSPLEATFLKRNPLDRTGWLETDFYAQLMEFVKEKGPFGLIVEDSLSRGMLGETNSDVDVNAQMDARIRLARAAKGAYIAVKHPTKEAKGDESLGQISGSIAFQNAAKGILIGHWMVEDKEDGEGEKQKIKYRRLDVWKANDGDLAYCKVVLKTTESGIYFFGKEKWQLINEPVVEKIDKF